MTSESPRQSGQRVSEYVLEAPLGAGAQCEVWRAKHHLWQEQRVAIKLPLRPENARYLQREGLISHRLRHPNIVGVLGIDPFAPTPYLVMELIDGPALRTVISDHPQGLPLAIAGRVLRGMLRALDAAHRAGVVHRDVKPANVLLALDSRPLAGLREADVRVSDFGFGLSAADADLALQSASLEREPRIVGTLAYLAPEQQEGQTVATAVADLYAVGVVLFEMLTGRRPNWAEVPSALRVDAPPMLDELFRRLCARLPARIGSAEEALRMLDAALPPLPEAAPTLPLTEPRVATVIPPPAPPPLPRLAARARAICPRCRSQAQHGAQYCDECGMQLVEQVRRCGTCGGYPDPDDRYCIHCGARLSSAAGSPPAPRGDENAPVGHARAITDAPGARRSDQAVHAPIARPRGWNGATPT